MNSRFTGLPLAALFVGLIFPLQIMAACQASGLQIQVLGSGGPGASSGRASTGYLLWLNGQSKVLIDADNAVAARDGRGGTAPARVPEQLAAVRAQVVELRERLG